MFFKYEVVGNGFVLPTQLNQLFPPKYYTQKCLILTLKKQFFRLKYFSRHFKERLETSGNFHPKNSLFLPPETNFSRLKKKILIFSQKHFLHLSEK